MTPEILSILGVGIALAGIILASQRQTRREIEQLRAEMVSRTDKLEAQMVSRTDKLEAQMISHADKQEAEFAALRRDVAGLDARLSRLEGVVSTALFNRPALVESTERGD